MAILDLTCSNPQCKKHLSFDVDLAGSVQPCPRCGRKLMLPELDEEVLPFKEPPPIRLNHLLDTYREPENVTPVYDKQKNSYQSRTRKQVKAGAGCMAMFGTIVGIFFIGMGLSMAGYFSWESMGGLMAFAGLAGVGAFAYFGYFAIEEDDDLYDQQRRDRRYQ